MGDDATIQPDLPGAPQAKPEEDTSNFHPAHQLEYEEPPEIAPLNEATPPQPEASPTLPPTISVEPPRESAPGAPGAAPPPLPTHLLGNIILFGLLFGVGVWLSMFLRQYLPSGVAPPPGSEPAASLPPAVPTAVPEIYPDWNTHYVLGSMTKQPIAGVSFKLPPEVLAPVCDSTNCGSQGTYLPGGSRFTVAPRGAGQYFADARGAAITDLAGRPLAMRAAA